MDLGELDIIAFASLKREVLDLNSHFPATDRIPASGLALAVAGRPDIRPCAVRPPRRTGLPAQQPRPQHCVRRGHQPVTPLQQLIAEVPQTGRVRWIGVRPASRGPMLELDAVEARLEAGLTGDHARPGVRNARQVTLIQWEHLAVINASDGPSR